MIIVVYEGVQSLDVTGLLEVFAGADTAVGHPGAYRNITAGLGGGPARTCSGLQLLPAADLDHVGPAHALLVPGGAGAAASDPAK